jgi:hypothetical protein
MELLVTLRQTWAANGLLADLNFQSKESGSLNIKRQKSILLVFILERTISAMALNIHLIKGMIRMKRRHGLLLH